MIRFLICAFLLASCANSDHSQPGVQKTPASSREDTLFLADDFEELGWDQYSYEDFDSGLVLFDSSLKYNPENSQAWHGRALMLHNLKRYDEAEIAYKNAEKYNSRNRQAIFHHGCMYAINGKKDEALVQLRRVIALDSSYAIGVRTEECWTQLWNDTDFLEVVGVLKASE
jgi:tetratricopeptide (TPR) repeat protein